MVEERRKDYIDKRDKEKEYVTTLEECEEKLKVSEHYVVN